MLCRLMVIAAVVGSASASVAQDMSVSEHDPEPALKATESGSFLPEALSPTVGKTPAFGYGSGRHDSSPRGPLVDSAVLGGPIATVATGAFAVFAQAGPSAFELANSPSRVGVAASAGIGAAY